MRFSKRSLEGEIEIDHRASPGLSEDIARWMDLPAESVAGGQLYRAAFYVCAHCQCEVVKNPYRQREREQCRKCDKYICDDCALLMKQTLACNNAQRQIDEALEQIEKFGSVSPLLLR